MPVLRNVNASDQLNESRAVTVRFVVAEASHGNRRAFRECGEKFDHVARRGLLHFALVSLKESLANGRIAEIFPITVDQRGAGSNHGKPNVEESVFAPA